MSIVTAYISASLTDSGRIGDLRDTLYADLGAHNHEYEVITQPHLTVLPSFDVDRSQLHRLNKETAKIALSGTTVEINGLGVWPHIRNPRVVLLDAEAQINEARKHLLDVLNDSDAENVSEPTPAHITLFMREKGYADPPPEFRHTLQEHIMEYRDPWETEIQHVDVIHDDC